MIEQAEKMVATYKINHRNQENQEIKSNFVLLSKKDVSIEKRRAEIDGAKFSIDFISSWDRFPLTIYTFEENGRRALERNVRMRVILEKPKDMNKMPEQVNVLQKFPNYTLRYILDPPEAIVGIFDKKRAIIKTCASGGLAESPSLWTDNPCLLSVISNYFEMLWNTCAD